MTRDKTFSKAGFQPLTTVAHPSGIDAVAVAARAHLVVCVTGVVAGRREVVGMTVSPLPAGFRVEAWPGSGTKDVVSYLHALLEAFAAENAGREFAPVSTALLRGIPLTTVLAFRQSEVEERLAMGERLSRQGVSTGLGSGALSGEDEQRLAYLDDALMYVEAIRERAKAAEVIARSRGISVRTAEGRIAKARSLGLLTEAEGRRASGSLTAAANRLADWRRDLSKTSV